MTPQELLIQQTRPDKVMPIYYLWRAIWRWVFDKYRCPFNHRSEVEKEILKWNNIVQFQKKIRTEKYGPEALGSIDSPVGQKGNPIDELEYQVGMMCKVLVGDENKEYDNTKDTFRIHNIDYRKSAMCKQWFPEFQDRDAKKKAQAYLEQNKKDNPEYYKEN